MRKFKLITANISFFLIVILPSFLALIYNFFIATPFYHSEAKLLIKSVGGQELTSGLTSVLRSVGLIEPSSVGAYIVMDYVLSRDFMFALDGQFSIKKVYSSSNIDFIQRFDPLKIDPSYENFFVNYYRSGKVVHISLDPHSSILTLRFRSPDPKYSKAMADFSTNLIEDFINNLNERSAETKLRYYLENLEENRRKIRELAGKIKDFMVKTQVLAPEQQAAVVLQTTSRLQEQLLLKQIEYMRIQAVAPDNPRLSEIKREIDELRKQIDKNISLLTGGSQSVGPSSVELELLKTDMQLLQKELEANLVSYLQAVNQLKLQQFFAERVESPKVADAPLEPERLKNILTVFAIALAIWGILSVLYAGVKEHSGR